MIGYDCTDAEMQPPDDEDVFTLAEEKIIDVLENNGFETVATILAGSDGWVEAINAYIDEQNRRRNEI